MHRRRATLIALGCALACVLSLIVAVPSAMAATRRQVLTAAATYGTSRGYHVGIAVYDTKTGVEHGAGDSTGLFVSHSVVKVLIATRLLVDGKMHGNVARLAYRMITLSDNEATDELYPLVGSDALMGWTEKRFHVPELGKKPTKAFAWGSTRLTPRGLVTFYAKIKKDKRVATWLLNAMHHIHRTSYVGEYQFWGLPSATSHAAVKQGWGIALGHANVNTTGFVNGDRYAVAIMTRGPVKTYGTPIFRMITGMAQRLLPGGVFPDPLPSVTSLSVTSGSTAGGTHVTIHGTSLTHVTKVYFGTIPAAKPTVRRNGTVDVIAPKHSAGRVYVRVSTGHGTSATTAKARFTYAAPTKLR